MRLYRTRPAALERVAGLQTPRRSAEEVLHPAERTTVFDDPGAVGRARARASSRALDAARAGAHGLQIDPGMGELARRAGPAPRLYRALRPQALAMLQCLGAAMQRDLRAPSRWS